MEQTPKILVADDEPINLELMESILSRLGYGVLLASDGNQALSLALDRMPDLILLDIMMPGLDGFEVTRKLKENDRTKIIPIVIVSGKSEVRDRVKALEAGADDFLNKPVDPTELQARIRSLLKVKAYNDHMVNYQKKLEEEVAKRTLQLKASLEKIKSASLEAIYRLSLAAEYKNKETGDHIKRVSHYAEAIASKMGLNKATIEAILYATPMHDVGKIGVARRKGMGDHETAHHHRGQDHGGLRTRLHPAGLGDRHDPSRKMGRRRISPGLKREKDPPGRQDNRPG